MTHTRLLSLDVLRGLALAGMILVNNPGDWGHIYAPLEHAPFIGLTLADLVFPTFMFVMGFSIPLSLRKYDFKPTSSAVWRIVRRTLMIWLVGFLLQWLSSGFTMDFSHFRTLGVLHRLAICYGLGALTLLWARPQRLLYVIVALLVTYLALLQWGNGYEWSTDNIVARVDAWVLGTNHMYVDEGVCLDPEGLLSTLPSLAHVLLGSLLSCVMMQMDQDTFIGGAMGDSQLRKVRLLLMAGGVSLAVGAALHFTGFCPVVKKVWTPSFVLVTTGLAEVTMALLVWLLDMKRWQGWWSEALRVFGINPLPMYAIAWVLADLLGGWGVSWSVYQWYAQWCEPCLASLLFALSFVALNWCIAWCLSRCRIILKA